METDGKRLLLAVAAAMGLMLVWNLLFPPEPKEKAETGADTTEVGKDGGKDAAADRPAESESEAGTTEPTVKGAEVTYELAFPNLKAVFSSYGGVVKSWTLEDSRFHVGDKQLDLVRGMGDEGYPFATSFAGSTFEVPDDSEWQGEKVSDREIVFRWASADLRVEKRFTVIPEDYLVRVDVEFKNLSDKKAEQALRLTTTSYQDPAADTGGGMSRIPTEWKAACFVGGELEVQGQKGLRKKDREWSGAVAWVGFTHSYFLTAIAPKTSDDESRFTCRATPAKGRAGAMRASLEFPAITLAAGDPSYTWSSSAFFGPKYVDKLDQIDSLVGYKTQLREAVDLGWFTLIARPLLSILKWFHGYVGNWGISIILLTLLVKLLLLPFTHKSMKSMKKMSALSPRMQELQKRYKDDKAAQQAAIMALYKQEGVNPLSGCLPMFLQMPIWIALYRMLMYAAELYHAPFGWVADLTSPDPLYILPVLLVIVMFLQAKLTPATGDGMQQKMLKYGMPLMFGGMGFMFPAGLTLYIFTNTLLTSAHHLVLRAGDPAKPAPSPKAADEGAQSAAESGVENAKESAAAKAPAKKTKKKGKRK